MAIYFSHKSLPIQIESCFFNLSTCMKPLKANLERERAKELAKNQVQFTTETSINKPFMFYNFKRICFMFLKYFYKKKSIHLKSLVANL